MSDLVQVETFKDKVSNIRSAETTKVMADKLLSLPADENYMTTIGPFISALRENGQAHIADVFTGSKEDLLADDDYQLLSDKLEILRSRLDPDCSIVTSLQSKRVFTRSDAERIGARKNPNEKVGKLIEILLRKSQSSFACFIAELKDHDQGHIRYILGRIENESPPISEEKLNILRRRRPDILRSMESKHTPFTSELLGRGIFSDVDMKRVEEMGQVHYKRNEQILDILARKSQLHLEMFISALVETGQEHVAKLFEDITISGRLHAEAGDACTQDAEALLEPVLARDFGDAESQVSRGLRDVGMTVAGVDKGCIRVWFKFLTSETLDALERGELDKLFKGIYCGLFPAVKNLASVRIEIRETEFRRCRHIIGERNALMKPEHQKALELAAEEIAKKLTVDEDLLKGLSLCAYRQDAILNQPTGEGKAKVLMEVMARRPDCEFQPLLNCLRETRQNDAARYITNGKNIN